MTPVKLDLRRLLGFSGAAATNPGAKVGDGMEVDPKTPGAKIGEPDPKVPGAKIGIDPKTPGAKLDGVDPKEPD